jgi:hypothetical protein
MQVRVCRVKPIGYTHRTDYVFWWSAFITRAHVQTIGVFPVPEFLTQRRRLFDPRSWFHHLQDDLSTGKTAKRGDFRLIPAFDFSREGSYQERFWNLFRGGPQNLPRHFPYKFRFETPTLKPIVGDDVLSKYQIRVRGLLYPYGAISLRISEYIEPVAALDANGILSILLGRLGDGSEVRTREGVMGEIKGRILRSFVKQDTDARHDTIHYRLVHFDTARELDPAADWNQLASLLAFSLNPSHVDKYARNSFPNLGFAEKCQLILMGPYAGFAYTPDLWTQGRVRSRRCLRNRLANLAELAMIQRQLYVSFSYKIRMIAGLLPLIKHRPLAEIGETIKCGISFHEIRSLYSILVMHDALNVGDRDVVQWKQWYDAVSQHLFSDRDAAKKAVEELNDLYGSIEKDAANAVAKTIEALSKIPFPSFK